MARGKPYECSSPGKAGNRTSRTKYTDALKIYLSLWQIVFSTALKFLNQEQVYEQDEG